MESKRQSKLPDGLGKKIIQALKTQGTPGQPTETGSEQPPANLEEIPYGLSPSAEEHGMETISHMDFGSEEVHYGQEQDLFQPALVSFEDDLSSPGFDNVAMANQAPQYGSFVDGSQDDFAMPGQVDPHLQAGGEEGTYMSPDQADQGGFEDFGYNQQSYEEFDYNQQSYDNFEASATQKEVTAYQMPKLGLPPQAPVEGQQMDDFAGDYGDFEDGYGYEEENTANQNIAPLDDFGYTTDMTPLAFEGESYQPELEQYEDYGNEEVQIGYSQDAITGKSQSREPQGLDLDAVPGKQAPQIQQPKEDFDMPSDEEFYSALYTKPYDDESPEAKQDKHYQQPKKDLRTPDEDDDEAILSKKKDSRREEHEPRIYRYEDDEDDDRYYHETRRKSSRHREERHHDEDREYRRYDDRHEDRDRDYRRYDDQYYDEEDRREARYKKDRYHRERDIEYRRSERRHHEDERDYDDDYYEKPRRGAKDSKSSAHRAEVLSSNVETLVRLVTSLPPGVTRQTGAQIIRQTMEAMGISMTDVLSDAQDSHKRLHKLIGDSFNKIEEHKTLVRDLEDDIHSFQKKAKELDDIISLFVLSEKHRNRH